MTIKQKIKKELPDIQFDVSLKKYSTFRIGGKAKYFFIAKNEKDLIKSAQLAYNIKMPFRIIGGGSNLLISDEGFDGMVIKTENDKFKIQGNKMILGAGLPSNQAVQIAAQEGLTGLEWLTGVPGTIGGAVYGNAGAFGGYIKDAIEKVTVFNLKKGKKEEYSNKDCQFSYRSSCFKGSILDLEGEVYSQYKKRVISYYPSFFKILKRSPNLIILSCEIQLKKGDKEEIQKQVDLYFAHRREKHPLECPSIGCIFLNPVIDGKEVSAWKIIADCGLEGKRVGNVKISKKHSNFIVNLGGGTAEEVKKLMSIIEEEVKKKFGIHLKNEVQYL